MLNEPTYTKLPKKQNSSVGTEFMIVGFPLGRTPKGGFLVAHVFWIQTGLPLLRCVDFLMSHLLYT